MIKKLLLVTLSLLVSNAAYAVQEFSECRHFFINGTIPVIQPSAHLRLRALCFSSFAIMHSGRSRTPLYVVERLNKTILTDAKDNKRTNRFFADARLPRSERAELDDFKGSGYDRGHN